MSFKTVLYPTDFSDLAEAAKNYIFEFKNFGARKVIILHVVLPEEIDVVDADPFAFDIAGLYSTLPEVERSLLDTREAALEQIKKEFEERGLKAEVVLKIGNPKEDIVEVAKKKNADLIVIGYHGKSLIEKIFPLGSTTKAVIDKAHCPVLVVKKERK